MHAPGVYGEKQLLRVLACKLSWPAAACEGGRREGRGGEGGGGGN